MPMHRRRRATQRSPARHCALRVPAARRHLLRYRSSTMCIDIACVAVPRIYPRGVRGGPLYFHHGLLKPKTRAEMDSEGTAEI